MKKFSKSFVKYVALILFLAIMLGNLFYYNPAYFPISLHMGTRLLLAGAFSLASFLGLKILQKFWSLSNNKAYMLYIVGLAFLLRLVWIFLVPTPPTQDYLQLLEASKAFAQGDLSYRVTNRYIDFYPYMNGFVIYQGLLLKFFDSIWLLKFVNCLFSAGTVYLVMAIGERLFNKKIASNIGSLMALYVPNIVLTSVLTNDILATYLFFYAFYRLTCYPLNLKNSLLIGSFICLGNFIRPMASVILLALFLYGSCILLPDLKFKKHHLLPFVMIFISFYVLSISIDQALLKTNLSAQSTQTTNLYWKLSLGLNPTSGGKWNQADYQFVEKGQTPAQRDELAKELVAQRTQNFRSLVKLMKDKFLIMWSDFDTSISWGTKKTRLPVWSIVILSGLQKCMYMIICFGAFRALKMKKMPQAVSFFLILMIGYVLVHQLIEIQTRYRYFIMPIFMLLAGSGLEQVDCHKKNVS